MHRYTGQRLPARPKLALITNDAIGNFVVTTPLAQMLRQAHDPAALDLYGGARTQELADGGDLYSMSYPLHGTHPKKLAADLLGRAYDLVINVEVGCAAKAAAAILTGAEGLVCGPCLDAECRGDLPFETGQHGQLWADPDWKSAEIVSRYSFLRTGWIGEIFCRLAYLDGKIPGYAVPTAPPGRSVPDALIAMSASLKEKLWTETGWIALVGDLRRRGLSVGLLGAPRVRQGKYWQGSTSEDRIVGEAGVTDLRGAFTLPQVVGALAEARLVVTLDNGILHLAAATQAPTVGLFREGIHRLWCPPTGRVFPVVGPTGAAISKVPANEVLRAVARALGA